ncbi:hypothetical protein LCER1_G004901 [Lachnellula cervina]|uniref:Uncharacterized protein n=1 Tax=Lachnellula cervina TaxID=1316786 RepID=A0A7D8YPT6_9HELO|nr:hypothetical protein LCER1_G004901 [Lachnellula cervina]
MDDGFGSDGKPQSKYVEELSYWWGTKLSIALVKEEQKLALPMVNSLSAIVAKNGGDMSGKGFASRAQSTGDKHANSSNSAEYAGAGGLGTNTSAGNAGNKAQK